ncbi:MAG: FHA domain-containing protein [Planctomycetia bacterium]|nr:FHA domain-containing protein [Planctomycetia bacterium]
MIAKLIVSSGKSAGRSIAIKRNTLLIGRAEQCDVRPLSEEVSRRHCSVTVGPTEVWVEDLGSRNGTFVNGKKITERTKVADGDMIRVGSLELKVLCTLAAPAKSGSEDDVSRWLMPDENAAGLSDTTRSLPRGTPDASTADADASNIHADAGRQAAADSTLEGSFVSGIGSTPAVGSGGASVSDRATGSVVLDALKAANSKPGLLPQGTKKPSADSSRDAAAEALKKFFEKK